MRRLANQSRDDVYTSSRDYQQLEERQGLLIQSSARDAGRVVVALQLACARAGDLVAFGGFVRPDTKAEVELKLYSENDQTTRVYSLDPVWSRVALGCRVDHDATALLSWDSRASVSVWGLAGGHLDLPPAVRDQVTDDDQLLADHLAPETFYFPHEAAIELELSVEDTSRVDMRPGATLHVKKCAYCGRFLPVDPNRPGQLSFHRHKAKRTLHQNECRACKKWRINDSFNPIRTYDQLHESSVITRERKLLLREPEILQAIKDRTGAGLKTQIWERFGRRCFACRKPLTLQEVRLDHTRPLAYLWPIDEYATCLCADHNGQKADRFPVDFYSEKQLRELAAITGLPLTDLKERSVNDVELRRILADPVTFAREWDSRLFVSTARRVAELRPEIDLMAVLQAANSDTYTMLTRRLADRRETVGPPSDD